MEELNDKNLDSFMLLSASIALIMLSFDIGLRLKLNEISIIELIVAGSLGLFSYVSIMRRRKEIESKR